MAASKVVELCQKLLRIIQDKWLIIEFTIFNFVLTFSDVVTDINQAVVLARSGHPQWGIATISLVFLPSLVSCLIFGVKLIHNLIANGINNLEKSMFYGIQSPIWHLPFLQLVNHWRAFSKLRDANRSWELAKKKLYRFKSLIYKKKIVAGDDGTTAEPEGDDIKIASQEELEQRIQFYSSEIARLEADFQKVKIMEAMFESGPQVVLQLAIIFQLGYISRSQVVTIVVSVASFWLSTTRFYLRMPTKTRDSRPFSWIDFVLTFMPMTLIILTRLVTWSLVLAYLDEFILVVLAISYTVLFGVWFKQSGEASLSNIRTENFIGLLTSILAPCVVQDEDETFFLEASLYSTYIMMALLPLLFIYAVKWPQPIGSNPPVFQCFPTFLWSPSALQTRCPYVIGDILDQNCTSNLVGFQSKLEHYVTVCREDESPHRYLTNMIVTLLVCLASSLAMSTFLQKYIDPVHRLVWSQRLTCGSILSWSGDMFKTSPTRALQVMLQKNTSLPDDSEHYTHLIHLAIQDELTSLVETILEKDKINVLDDAKNSLLHKACSTRNGKIIQLVLNKYHESFSKNNKQELVLGETISLVPKQRLGRKDFFTRILNSLDDTGMGVVHHCAGNGHVQLIMKWCIDFSDCINLSLETAQGYNLVDLASQHGHVDLLDFLNQNCYKHLIEDHLARSALTNNHKRSVIHLASYQGHLSVIKWFRNNYDSSIESLLKARDVDDDDALHKAPIRGHLDVIKYFHRNYGHVFVDFLEPGFITKKLFHTAATFGQLKVLKWLYRKFGQDIDFCQTTTLEGNNILHFACRKGHLDVVKWIVKTFVNTNKLDINAVNNKKMNVFILAVRGGHMHVLKYLHEKFGKAGKLNYKAKTEFEWSVFHYAVRFGNIDVLKWLHSIWDAEDLKNIWSDLTALRSNSKANTIFHLAVVGGDIEAVQWILEAFADHRDEILEQTTGSGNSSLNMACIYGHLHLVKYFSEKFPEHFNLYQTNHKGWTPIHSAAAQGHLQMLQWMRRKLATNKDDLDLGMTNGDGHTLMHLAAHGGHMIVCRWLIETFGLEKCNLSRLDNYGCSPVHLVPEDNPDLKEYLLEFLANKKDYVDYRPYEPLVRPDSKNFKT